MEIVVIVRPTRDGLYTVSLRFGYSGLERCVMVAKTEEQARIFASGCNEGIKYAQELLSSIRLDAKTDLG